jgi:hypothetical protein
MRGVLVDANLFLLLTVGAYGKNEIARHRRLRSAYDQAAFDRLFGFISLYDKIVAVPGLLTEVSNLLSDGEDPGAVGIKQTFALPSGKRRRSTIRASRSSTCPSSLGSV